MQKNISITKALEIATEWCEEKDVDPNKEFWNNFLWCVTNYKRVTKIKSENKDFIIQCAIHAEMVPKFEKILAAKKLKEMKEDLEKHFIDMDYHISEVEELLKSFLEDIKANPEDSLNEVCRKAGFSILH